MPSDLTCDDVKWLFRIEGVKPGFRDSGVDLLNRQGFILKFHRLLDGLDDGHVFKAFPRSSRL